MNMTQPKKIYPPHWRSPFAGWFAPLGAAVAASSLGWYFLDSSLFILQMPILIVSIVLGLYGWMSILQHPPKWLPVLLIVFVYFIVDFTIRTGNVVAGGFDAQSIMKGMVWIVLLSFGLIHGLQYVFSDKLLISFFIYTVFAFFSAFYSRALLLGIGSGFALIALSCFAGEICTWTKATLDKFWTWTFFASALIAVLSLLLYVGAPQIAIDMEAGPNRLRGVTGSGNSLGPIMCIGILAGVYLWSWCEKWMQILVSLGIVALLAALVMSQSKGSMFGLIAGFLLVAAFSNVFTLLFTVFLCGISFWSALQPGFIDGLIADLAGLLSRSGRVNELTSFTGRSEIWRSVFEKWLGSPWIGYGLGSPRIIVSEAYADQWGHTHESAHNWLLESLISFGVSGTAILVTFLTLLAWRLWAFKSGQFEGKLDARGNHDWPLVLCMKRCFIFCMVSGMMEKAFAGMPNPTLILLSCMAGTCVVLQKRETMEI